MDHIKQLFPWAGGLFISAIFLDSLRFKFTSHPTPEHIFTTLRDWSGIGLFFPAGPWVIGLGELLSSILLIGLPLVLFLANKKNLIAPSQFLGALIALGIMSGAIVFHLFTPLGIETPVEWANGEPTEFSSALFYAACASWLFALIILFLHRNSIAAVKSPVSK
ncbi:hypothetical protein PUV54_06465 [Hyphococcus flavus]|uniref:DoxX family protein n=1 Tax=Hyphococcus flavus TaxID=1866326 RepID=A0AAE9ZDL6_9PROT|nr:hypothetical protein [Hyphococcus flavus]WDI32839.1 hypothetical protein PUV54_06465 [Hyphococcus flavus]